MPDVQTGRALKFAVYVANFGPFGDASVIGELAERTESAGWSGFFIWDHVARAEGVFPMVDPWIALAVAATRTRSVRLGALVTPLARRRPWNVAREVATLDHLSGGRMVLGIGLGESGGPEFRDFSEPSDARKRGDLLDEGLVIIRTAWSGEPVNHEGHHRLDGVAFLPRPLQSRVPIWAATERLRGRPVRRAAGLQGVFPIGVDPEEIGVLLAEIGRNRPAAMEPIELIATGTDDWAAWQRAGASWWLRDVSWREPLGAARAIIDAGPPG
jgi:alkanesulfonate monooxygenase SsuD/methylene tetrahydromethanopterin reductase-like flavin-dependent oxidoreductase (luciferase family)